MQAHMMLADSAQVVSGKLYILGGGWNVCSGAVSMAVTIRLSHDPGEVGRERHWALFLEDADGKLVLLEGLNGPLPIEVHGDLFVEADPQAVAGVSVEVPLAVNFPALPLPAGHRLVWRLTIDGETPAGGTVAFSTRAVVSA